MQESIDAGVAQGRTLLAKFDELSMKLAAPLELDEDDYDVIEENTGVRMQRKGEGGGGKQLQRLSSQSSRNRNFRF